MIHQNMYMYHVMIMYVQFNFTVTGCDMGLGHSPGQNKMAWTSQTLATLAESKHVGKNPLKSSLIWSIWNSSKTFAK